MAEYQHFDGETYITFNIVYYLFGKSLQFLFSETLSFLK